MKSSFFLCPTLVAASLLWVSLSAAESAAPEASSAGPRAQRGFQLALRTGYSIPLGDILDESSKSDSFEGQLLKDSSMSSWFGGQVPFLVEIGGKPHEHVFIGGVLGFSSGAASDSLECSSCSAFGAYIGAEVLYSFLPAAKANPWLGYGLGFEYNQVGDGEGSVGFSGFVPAAFSTGVDFRINRVFGLGPFVGLSLGRYSSIDYAGNEDISLSRKIEQRATHEWLTFGIRGVFFP